MQFERILGVCEACDRVTQQLGLEVEQRHAPALG